MKFVVSPDGKDANPGTQAQPFATLQRTRDALRTLDRSTLPEGPVVIELTPGVYRLDAPLEFTENESGTPAVPVEIRAQKPGTARIAGSRPVTGWQPISNGTMRERLATEARDHVLQADLRALGITDFQGINSARVYESDPGLELFCGGRSMTLARYPNEGYMWIKAVVASDGTTGARDAKTEDGTFVCEDPRPANWADESDVWLHGFWFRDWRDERYPLGKVDPEAKTISFPPRKGGSYAVRRGQWFYAQNVFCELDRPGEWYLDRQSGILYFWPPEDVSPDTAEVSVTRGLLRLDNASHITFRGLLLDAARGTAVEINGGSGVRIVGCTIRNQGNWAVRVTGGTDHGVIGCDITRTGQGGIHLEGGDRKTLTPAGHFADNNHIHHTSRWDPVYQQAIALYGVGNSATHNLIDNVPHIAIGFSHNDHVIEYNEIHSSVFQSNDAGAIYTSPPNETWSMRGHRIRFNYLHNIHGFEGRGCNGVYLDDCFSSADISGNIFYDVANPILIGGGRDNIMTNNLFINCRKAFHIDARGLGWAKAVGTFATKELHDLKHTEPPWSEHYPQLVGILDDDPLAPKGNVMARNVCWGGPWGWTEPKAMKFVTFENNLIDVDPQFVKPPPESFALKASSPAYDLGFWPIPFERIGLYQSPDRASWPVSSPLRDDPAPPPPKPKPTRKPGPKPTFDIPRRTTDITVDGALDKNEWFQLDPEKGIPLREGVYGETVRFPSHAWLAWDDNAIYVAVDNAVDKNAGMGMDDAWGGNDAVEIAVSNGAEGNDAPILVLRGFACGAFVSSEEAGASAEAVENAAKGVAYSARVIDKGRWTAEFRIPFAALGIHPAPDLKCPFNLSVRKQGDDPWVMWRGTGNCTWYLPEAGIVSFPK
jgi:hypothetical protein